MTRKTNTMWLDRALIQGPYMALFTSEKDFLAECKALNCENPPEFVSSGAGATVHHLEFPDGREIAMVCMDMAESLKHDKTVTYCLLVHEAVHVYQQVRDWMNEAKPSIEFEAYSIQSISQRLIDDYDRQRKAYQCKKKPKK